MPKEQKYCLSFSGGKDSHVLLAIYLCYLKLGNPPLDLVVKFADTKLEHSSLYTTINKTKQYCDEQSIPFEIVEGKQSYWYIQFALGYPVPDYRIRWCTGKLKISPMQPSKKIKAISGRHLGESKTRDHRLKKSCGSDTCGSDLIKDKYDPLLHWRNCLIWDAIFYFEGTFLYQGVFDLLMDQYKQAGDSKTGSLRLGCFMCPVITVSTIEKNRQSGLINDKDVKIRYLLEELRAARRINNPRTKKRGSIYIGDRRKFWQKLDKDYLVGKNWLDRLDLEAIDLALQSDYSYPPLYTKDWIDSEHERLLTTGK